MIAWAHRFPQLRYRMFVGREASTIGLGPSRQRGAEDPSVVLAAIASGCNVLDTAPHYRDAAHERCIGEALRLAAARGCDRASLVITTQVGRVPELVKNNTDTIGFARLKQLVEERFVRPGIFGWDDLAQGKHVMAPRYIEHSIAESLSRTGAEYFDCVFLESPMLQLRAVGPTEFRRRLLAAFETLEGLCDAGIVRSYGISTSTPVDLSEWLTLARTAANGEPRISAVRFPFSLLRQEHSSFVEEAARRGLHVFAAGCLDGGTPQYQFPDDLDAWLGSLPDTAAAIRWCASAPGVGTALFASRDARHVRANLAAAALPPLARAAYDLPRGDSP